MKTIKVSGEYDWGNLKLMKTGNMQNTHTYFFQWYEVSSL